jgi:hypothetical protein
MVRHVHLFISTALTTPHRIRLTDAYTEGDHPRDPSGKFSVLTHGSRGKEDVDIKAGSNVAQQRKKPEPEPFRGYDQNYGGLVGGFIESQHPRSHGKFTKKGTGSVGSKAKSATKSALGGAKALGKQLLSEGRPDFEALKQHFGSEQEARKTVSGKLRHAAKTLPILLKTHLKHMKHEAVAAGSALKNIKSGKKPSAHEVYALGKFAFTVTMSLMSLAHGDPTGGGAVHAAGHAVGGAIMGMIQEVVQEAAVHTGVEHAAETSLGLGRYAGHKARQLIRGREQPRLAMASGDAAPDDFDYSDLQKFLERLADCIEKRGGNNDRPAARK